VTSFWLVVSVATSFINIHPSKTCLHIFAGGMAKPLGKSRVLPVVSVLPVLRDVVVLQA